MQNTTAEFRRFVVKLSLFVCPFFAAFIAQSFILPFDYFNFRVWEAFTPVQFKDYLPGYFYPNCTLKKTEEGDLGHGTRYASKKNVLWITDEYGFRNRPCGNTHYPVVIVGDSNTVGSSLTQDDCLAEVLAAKSNVPVYSVAPVRMSWFIAQKRFIDDPPKVVILQNIERAMSVAPLDPVILVQSPYSLHKGFLNAVVRADVFCKVPMLLYARARLKDSMALAAHRLIADSSTDTDWLPFDGILANDQSMIFIDRGERIPDVKAIADVLLQYQMALRQRNIRFIYLPIPEKSNIYFRKLGKLAPPRYLSELIQLLRARNIDVVDLQAVFDRERDLTGQLLFQPDDSHWTPHAVRLAVDELLPHLQRQLQENP